MLSKPILCITVVVCCFLFDGVVDARRLFGDTRRDYYKRAAAETEAHTRSQQLHKRSRTSDFRFYNNKSAAYNVESLPLMPFDIGEFYSGVIPVDKSEPDRGMFFVFQPRVGGPPVDEVTVWFNGGPGCSSLEGFLQENGRFQWAWGQQTPLINQYSWVNLTNMLWVEYPVGVGFSQGKVTAKSEEETAQDFLGFFKNFEKAMGIKNFKIYVTGESYAGRYVPYVSAAMLDEKDKEYFDLSGALVYDPCIGQFEYVANQATIVPFVKKHNQFFNLGKEFMKELDFYHETCGYRNFTNYFMSFPPRAVMPAIAANVSVKCDLWGKVYQEAYRPNPCFNVYEISVQCPLMFDPLAYPSDIVFNYPNNTIYFNRRDVKEAMHAPLEVQWRECSGPVFVGSGGIYGFGDKSLDPAQHVLPQVIEATNRVLVANGDFDMEILTEGTLLSIQNMTWNGKMGFQTKPHTPIDIKLPDLQYQKVFKHSGLADKHGGFDGPGQGVMGVQHYERGLMWAETYQSGHMQPQFQARSSYRHLQWVLGRIDEL